MKHATRMTSKGQVVIPKPVREQLRWTAGAELAVELGDDAVRLRRLEAGNPIDILYGCLKDLPRDPLADLEAEHQAEIEAEEHSSCDLLHRAPLERPSTGSFSVIASKPLWEAGRRRT